jgi:hypothetical protein
MDQSREKPVAKQDARPGAPGRRLPETVSLRKLQHAAGNTAFTRLVQAKRNVSQPGEASEREADRVASDLERGAGPGAISPARTTSPRVSPASIERVIGESGSPLAPATRAYFEHRLRADLSRVRVHTGSVASASAREIQARAYTTGNHIVFRSGEYAPQTSGGLHLLAHELTHVLQQAGGQGLVQRDGDPQPAAPPAAGGAPADAAKAAESKRVAGITSSTTDEKQMIRALTIKPAIERIQKESVSKENALRNADPNWTWDDVYAGKYRDLQQAKDNEAIQALLDSVGLASTLDLYHIEQAFPAVFRDKAYNLTMYMLEENEKIAKRESERYQAAEGIKPDSDVSKLKGAAAAIAAQAAAIIARYDELRAKRDKEMQASSGQKERYEIRWSGQIQGNPALNAIASEDPTLSERLLPAYQDRINIEGGRFPILLTPGLNFEWLAQADAQQLENIVKGRAGEVLENITKVREQMKPEKIWELPVIMDRTRKLLGVRPSEGADQVLQEHMEAIGNDEFLNGLLLGALGIAFGLVAMVGTGGLALLGLLGSAALSTYGAAKHWNEYEFKTAASDSALDPAQVIAKENPSLFWLAVDLLAAGLDIGTAAIAFRNMARAFAAAIKTEKALQDLEAIARAQYKAFAEGHVTLTEDQFVKRLVGSVKKGLASSSEQALKQVRVLNEIIEGTSPRMAAILTRGDKAAMQELLKEHGNWKELMGALAHSGGDTEKVAARLKDFRNDVVAEMKARGASPVGGASTEAISDVDLNVVGPDAGKQVLKFEAEMAERFGDHWSQALRMNFYTEASRLTLYAETMKDLSAPARRALLRELTHETQELTFIKMLEHAKGDPASTERVERLIAASGKGGELERLKGLIKTPEQHAARRAELLVQIDKNLAAYRASPSAEKAKAITKLQMEANYHSVEAYIGPGAARMTVSGVPVVGHEAYQSALSDLEMIEHILHESHGSVVGAGREYEFYKYVNRYATAARNAGVHSDRLTYFEHLSEYLYRRARGAQGEYAHLQVPERLLDQASEIKVTDAFVQQQIKEFHEEVEATLPRILKEAEARPDAWARTPLKKPPVNSGLGPALPEEAAERFARPEAMSGSPPPPVAKPAEAGMLLKLQGNALAAGWIDTATRLDAIEKAVNLHINAIRRAVKEGHGITLSKVAAGRVIGRALANMNMTAGQNGDLTHVTVVIEPDGEGGFQVVEAYPE